MRNIVPRQDQERLASEILSIIQKADHAYLESPTGTGKTLTIALVGEASGSEIKVLLAHSLDIVDQLKERFDEYANEGIISNRNSWYISTWHVFVSRHKAGTLSGILDGHTPEIVFVDECHMGGSVRHTDKIAFQAIRSASNKVIWVSATPWRVDEVILGQRAGHTALLTMEEAVQLRLLNPTEMIRVDCGLKLRAAISELELSTSKSYAALLGQVFEADGDDVVDAFDKLDEDLDATIGRGLRVSDLKLIASHVARLMADLYLERHRGEKALFWVPNRAIAKAIAKYIQDRLPGNQRAEAIISDTVRSTAEDEYILAARHSFSDPNGDVAVACVVYRLKEGFDFPELSLGFDCSWNPFNLANTVQKIGRLIRVAPEKPCGQFYYAVSVKTIAGTKAMELDDRYLDEIAIALNATLKDRAFAGEALVEAGAFQAMMNGQPQHTAASVAIENATLRGSTYRLARTPLFDFEHVSQYSVVRRTPIEKAIRNEHEDWLAGLVEKILHSIEFGPRMSISAQYKSAIAPFFVPGTSSFNQSLYDRLERLRPQLLQQLNGHKVPPYQEKLEAIMARIRAGGDPPAPQTEERTMLQKAMWPHHNCYRPEILEEMKLICPELVPVPKDQKRAAAQVHVDRVLAAIRSGEIIADKADKKRLERWLSRNCNKFRQDVFDEVARHRPELLPDKALKGEKVRLAFSAKKGRNSDRNPQLRELSMAYIKDRALPSKSNPDWYRVRGWLRENPSVLEPEDLAFVTSRWPAIFEKAAC